MKKILYLLLLFSFFNVYSQTIEIADPFFKKYLIEGLNLDSNNDGEIQKEEADKLKEIILSGSPIKSFKGINNFSNLESILLFEANELIDLDVSGLQKLKRITLTNAKKLKKIKLREKVNLLEAIYFVDTPIKEINLDNSPNLKSLTCSNCDLNSINLSKVPNLTALKIDRNNLKSINLTQVKKLQTFWCGFNPFSDLSFLKLDNFHDIENLEVNGLGLNSLNFINKKTKINRLYCTDNNLKEIPYRFIPNIEYLNCSNNKIKDLKIKEELSQLNFLVASDNKLKKINLSYLPKLVHLVIHNNQLEVLDLSQNHEMEMLSAVRNNLTHVFLNNKSKQFELWGVTGVYSGLSFNKNLRYVCVDKNEVELAKKRIKQFSEIPKDVYVGSGCNYIVGEYKVKGNVNIGIDKNNCNKPLSNIKFEIFDGVNKSFANNYIKEEYELLFKEGKYIIKPTFDKTNYFSVYPNELEVSFPSNKGKVIEQNFCLIPKEDITDVDIKLIPTTVARPGFMSSYKIIIENIGTTTSSGEIELVFDETILNFVNSSISPAVKEIGKIKWNYDDLLPFSTREINFKLKINKPTDIPSVNGGDILELKTKITTNKTDENLSNNDFKLNQEVVDSFDPNDKRCLEGKVILEENLENYIHYMIRFENTGTAEAVNVIISDVIDLSKFDISTLKPVHASHNFITRTVGNKVDFIFENINLPFEEEKNRGYVVFKIKLLNFVTVGDEFKNLAAIFFDFNKPIITNEFITTVEKEKEKSDLKIVDVSFFPNPFDSKLSIKSNYKVLKIEVYDLLGRKVREVNNSLNELNSLSKGIYLIQVTTEKGVVLKKVLKK